MAKKRGGLGRGLESLFEDVSPSFESDNKVETLPSVSSKRCCWFAKR